MLGGLIVVMTIAFIFSLAVAHLLSFHIYLKYRGLSTYDFILESRRKASVSTARKRSPATMRLDRDLVVVGGSSR